MSRHLVTVCMFCLLCAAHSVCGTHIDDNDLEQNDRVVTFNTDFQKGPFDLMSQSYDPILDDSPQDHDVKKKNLSAERRLRYMQKLNKIRSHRRYDFDSGRDRVSSEEELVLDDRNVEGHPRLEERVGDHKNGHSKISDKLGVGDDGFLNSVMSDKNLDLNDDDSILKGRISDLSADTEQIFNSDENKQRLFGLDANQRTFDLLDRRFGDGSTNFDEKNSALSDKGSHDHTNLNTELSERLFGFRDDVVLSGNEFSVKPVSVSDKDLVKGNSVVLRTRRSAEDVIKIDPSAYVEQIFNQFGDAKSMTMNLTGFNELLRFLDLQTLIEGGKQNIKKPDYVYKEAPLQDAEVTCLSSSQLVSAVRTETGHSHDHSHEHSHGHSDGHSHRDTRSHSDDTLINEKTMQSICPILLYQKLANKSLERNGCVIANQFRGKSRYRLENEANAYAQNQMHVWVYSFLSILVISACGLLGVAVIPIMHKSYYNHLLQFLVALAVGTLCGDALLHLMPHAMSPLDGEEQPSHDDSMWKGLVAMMGVVFFYFTEKGLTVAAEMRKRRQKKDDTKLPPRVRVLKDDNHTKSRVSGSSSNPFLKIFNSKNKGKDVQKTCKHKYSEYPYCYDEIDTETQNDHHLRENQSPKPNLSIVSSKVATEAKEDGNAKDWLLNYMEESDGKPKVGENNAPVEMNNINNTNAKKKDTELKEGESYTVILREHSRAHHGHSHSHGHVHAPPSSMSSVAWMVIMGDGLHNFTDGMAIGAAFASNLAGGFSTAIAVLCHELPHELGDFAVLLKAGMSVRRAVWYNALSSILCLGGMVCGVLVGHAPSATRWLFALAAGMFLYIALVDMMPELSSSHSKEGTFCQCVLQLLGLATGVGIMLLIALYEHDLRTLFG